IGASADVFSLGCVLFECLTGRAAFPGERLMEVLAKILFSEAPRVSDLREGVPPALDELVLRMMQKRADERPTLPAVASELEAIAAMPRLRELRPRARAASGEGGEPAVSGDEQRLMSVVLASEEASKKL